MTKTNYKLECKRQKEQISELQHQIATLKDRLDVLRKAKNQTILKTEIVNRQISEPQFGNSSTYTVPPEETSDVASQRSTKDCGTNTDKLPETVPQEIASPKVLTPEPEPPKRTQRKRVKENWSQCQIYTANKYTQVQFVQTCHCEGVGENSGPRSQPVTPKCRTPISLPKIQNTSNTVSCSSSPAPEFRTLSRMKTKDYISAETHTAEIQAIELAFKLEREKQINIHSKEVRSLKEAIEKLNDALKSAVEENVKNTISTPNGSSVFHLYAEEKRRMEEQVRHLNSENNKLRAKVKKLTQNIQQKDEEWEENEEAIKKHYVETWDEQYRSWMNKTESRMNFLRSSNENMQTFIMKNARHLPFAATDELKIFNEYGEKVSVFQ